MKKAIDETNRRRKIQMEFNEKHGITPETIKKAVRDVVRAELAEEEVAEEKEELPIFIQENPEEAMKTIRNMERAMFEAAKKLEFEEAARLRDEIAKIRKGLGLEV